jgi:hypothetical protein
MDRHKTTKLKLQEKIGHFAMNTKIPFFWKRQMFNMQQFHVGGIP